MKAPSDRRYTETHEWWLVDGDVLVMGITQYAADELTDITYVELPDIGKRLAPGDTLGEIESVKATSEVYSSVNGTIVEVNEALVDHPELLNDDAYEEGWIAKIKADSNEVLQSLMTAKEYKSLISRSG